MSMTAIIVTIMLILVIAKTVYNEIKYGRKTIAILESTHAEITILTNNVSRVYRSKFGKDPSDDIFRT